MAKHTATHTDADKERFRKLSEMGCIVCRDMFGAFVQGEVAHLTAGGRRTGHQRTIPLCPWHHRAVPGDMPPETMRVIYGPSFAEDKGAFERTYGTEKELLEKVDRWLGLKRNQD